LVVEITPLVFDMVVDSGQLLDSFLATVAGSFPPGYLPLHPAKLRLCGLVIPGIPDDCPVTEDGKARYPNINACCVAGCWQWGREVNLDIETHIPAATVSSQRDCFDAACYWSVELYLEFTNSLNVEAFILSQLTPVAIFRERVTVKPGHALKSRVACDLSLLHPAKEGLKCFLHPAQDILATRVICQGEVARSPDVSQLLGLLVVRERRFPHLPGITPFLHGSVI
jgi:hypothetical protein